MAKFNMCNRFDQVTGGVVIYAGTEFKEYEDLEQPDAEEKERKPFSIAAVTGNIIGSIAVGVFAGAAVGAVIAAGIFTGGLAWAVGGAIAGAIAGVVAAKAIEQGIEDSKENKTTSATEYLAGALRDAVRTGGKVMDAADHIFFVKGMIKNLGKNLIKKVFKSGTRKRIKIPKLNSPNKKAKPPKKSKLREKYLGRTPSKKSKTGREVIERMEKEGQIRTTRKGERQFKSSDGNWYNIDKADMAHRTDAVSWWNQTGRMYGAKSKEVREWMLDADNYVLEHRSINRSQGAKLKDRYLPPLK